MPDRDPWDRTQTALALAVVVLLALLVGSQTIHLLAG